MSVYLTQHPAKTVPIVRKGTSTCRILIIKSSIDFVFSVFEVVFKSSLFSHFGGSFGRLEQKCFQNLKCKIKIICACNEVQVNTYHICVRSIVLCHFNGQSLFSLELSKPFRCCRKTQTIKKCYSQIKHVIGIFKRECNRNRH